MSGIRSIPLSDADSVPVMTIAMFHERRAAQDGLVVQQMTRKRQSPGAVRALYDSVGRDPMSTRHTLTQPFGISGVRR
jgi:hypothetical protein